MNFDRAKSLSRCYFEPAPVTKSETFSFLFPSVQMLLDFQVMRLDDLDYYLPPSLIAQKPLDQRDASRLLVVPRVGGNPEDRQFADLPGLLRGDEMLVLNNTRVIPARLFGRRAGVHSQPPSGATRDEHLTGKVEVFLTRQL